MKRATPMTRQQQKKRVEQALRRVEQVIAQGPYRDDWASLADYPVPKWYRDAKFGIFVHWGVYSVPAFGNEWYPRNMYLEGTPEFAHHVATYGPHSRFGYRDFVPMFRAEKFDSAAWMELFRQAGAKFVMPVAEHHDGFQMYDSELSDWCAANMGPERDVLGELKQAAEAQGLVFCVSNHRAENYWFFNGASAFDSGVAGDGMQEPYGFRDPAVGDDTNNVLSAPASKEHLDDWLARVCELVDKYRPRVVWFDWWIQNHGFKPYLKKFAAYYYNRAAQWGVEVAINYKFEAFARSTAVLDIERGQLSGISPRFWQTDTAVAKNSWCYTENNEWKEPEDIVCDLVDIVSKNGALLLNVGPKADGTLAPQDVRILREIGAWMKKNGEGIYGTSPWSLFGEGPTQVAQGAFTDTARAPFTEQDVRYTYRAPHIYAFAMKMPADGEVSLRSLGFKTTNAQVVAAELLGFPNAVAFHQDGDALKLCVSGRVDTAYPVCFRVTVD